jgi:hypothetical protein
MLSRSSIVHSLSSKHYRTIAHSLALRADRPHHKGYRSHHPPGRWRSLHKVESPSNFAPAQSASPHDRKISDRRSYKPYLARITNYFYLKLGITIAALRAFLSSNPGNELVNIKRRLSDVEKLLEEMRLFK